MSDNERRDANYVNGKPCIFSYGGYSMPARYISTTDDRYNIMVRLEDAPAGFLVKLGYTPTHYIMATVDKQHVTGLETE